MATDRNNPEEVKRDIAFLRELHADLDVGRSGDRTWLDALAEKLNDWVRSWSRCAAGNKEKQRRARPARRPAVCTEPEIVWVQEAERYKDWAAETSSISRIQKLMRHGRVEQT